MRWDGTAGREANYEEIFVVLKHTNNLGVGVKFGCWAGVSYNANMRKTCYLRASDTFPLHNQNYLPLK